MISPRPNRVVPVTITKHRNARGRYWAGILFLLALSAAVGVGADDIYLPSEISSDTLKNILDAPAQSTLLPSFSDSLGLNNLTTEWVGHPMVSDNDKFTPSMGWLPDVEIGLRSDGVVVWRKKQ